MDTSRLRITTALQRYVDYGKHKSSPVTVTERLGIIAQPANASIEGLPGPKAQPTTWARFLHSRVPELRAQGWDIEIDPSVHELVFDLSTGATPWTARVEEQTGDWFDLDVGVQIGEERVPLLPLIVDVLRNLRDGEIPRGDVTYAMSGGRAFVLPMERVRAMLQTLVELLEEAKLNALGRVTLNKLAAMDLAQQMDRIEGEGEGAAALRALSSRLSSFERVPDVPVPDSLHATLRGYQHEGFRWLRFLYGHDCGGILADDMGLGKSIQAIAHLLLCHGEEAAAVPSLLVVPTSLVPNWLAEIQRFAPSLRVLTLHGAGRARLLADVENADVVITTYALLSRDAFFQEREWHVAILDEAQAIKNPLAKVSRTARKIKARQRICLTGTPMENHLGELWSLFDFVMPHALYDQRTFAKLFRTPIEQEKSTERRDALARRIRPFMLRRTKADVAMELPEKTEIVERVELPQDQRDLYESVRLAVNQEVRAEIARLGIGRSRIAVLDALLKLRQVCCDPRLVKIPSARRVHSSAKLEWLVENLSQLAEEGRKTLVFSQFTSMIDLIKPELEKAGIGYVELVGSTVDRATPVRRFQNGEVPVFLISLRAGGTGLNLTAADTVIHYDPWWNPAVERQATDRAHRIGQDKPIFVYKLVAAGTVEEKILDLQARKAELAGALFDAADISTIDLGAEDIDALFGADTGG
ncbi:MAG TPA: DEAD/DEAH box helicase [Candidatus Baltobacteraceae bacterium]|nr:DEAD/DEAH box helicase [Candidatus Baltobacteraceae bacterium]